MLSLNRFPEWTPDGAGVGPAIDDGPNDFDLTSPAVASAKRQSAICEVGNLSNWPAGDRDDLGCPADIGVAHGDRPATFVAPRLRLQICKVGIPGDVNARRRIARLCEKRCHLHFITLKQNHLDWQVRFFVKVSPHSLPYTDHFGIVCHGAYPDCSAHNWF